MLHILDNLNEEQRKILKQFRLYLGNILTPEDTDYLLVKYLKARNFDLEVAVKIYKENYYNRITFGVNTILDTYTKPETGNDIHEITYIMDFEGFALQQVLHKSVIELGLDYTRLAQDCYPEVWSHILMVNVPKIFDRAFNLFKPVIRMTSLERIFIADKASTKDLLLKYIDENVLPAFLGGSRVDSKGDPECKEFITFGGKVPEKFYLKNCRIPLSPSDPNVKCMTVRARSMKNVSCVVKEAKTKIRFQLKSENGSIYFSVLYREFGPNPDDIELPEEDEYLDETADNFKYKQISVELRVQAHCAQEDLTTILPWPGIYVVRLNNSSNWFTSRKLMVKLELFPPSKEAK